MASPLLEVVDLDVFYGDAQAVWDMSFRVGRGGIVALVGTNGAGKSTVLNAVSMFVRARRGSILWSGRPLARLEPEQRAVVVLRFFLELSLSETAAALGIPIGTAKSRLHRSLAQMRIEVTSDDVTPIAAPEGRLA